MEKKKEELNRKDRKEKAQRPQGERVFLCAFA
jgi:hypothetical protein